MDRVTAITDAKGGVTTYTYTKRGEVASKKAAECYVTSYEYDGRGTTVSVKRYKNRGGNMAEPCSLLAQRLG